MIFDSGCTATAGFNEHAPLTLESVLASMAKAKRELEQIKSSSIGGTPLSVRESQYATRAAPVRLHNKRRNQSQAYHSRVQKKWLKRFGTKQEPCAYLIDDCTLSGIGRTLIVNPQRMIVLRNLKA